MAPVMKAWVISEDRKPVQTSKAVPTPSNNEALVKIHSVAINPTDWKHLEAKNQGVVDSIIGCDFSGVVEEYEGDENVKKGDRVAGFVHGSNFPGSFAEYVTIDAGLLIKLPDSIGFDQSATIPLAYHTAVQALFGELDFPIPNISSSAKIEGYLLVWGGSTSVGQYAIQLASSVGVQVVTTCSPENDDLLKSLGAEKTFNYKDDDVVKQIKEYTKDRVRYGLDCQSTKDSQKSAAESFGKFDSKSQLITVLPVQGEFNADQVSLKMILVYTIFGRDFTYADMHFTKKPEMFNLGRLASVWATELLSHGKLRSNQPRVTGGFDTIPEALNLQKDGVKAQKVVVRVQD